jgi:hypothetical protein
MEREKDQMLGRRFRLVDNVMGRGWGSWPALAVIGILAVVLSVIWRELLVTVGGVARMRLGTA